MMHFVFPRLQFVKFFRCSEISLTPLASARCTLDLAAMKLFQQFSTACGNPLKRLSSSTGTMHRAKAPVLMRKSQRGRGSLIRATTLACIVMAFSAFGAEDEAV